MAYELNFRKVTYALPEALDLVGIDDVYHGKRVASMAAKTGSVDRVINRSKNRVIEFGIALVPRKDRKIIKVHILYVMRSEGKLRKYLLNARNLFLKCYS